MIASLDSLLWSLARKFRTSGAYSREDLYCEARLAALIAIQKFKKEKKTRLSTFVYRAALNHLIEIQEREKKRGAVESSFVQDTSTFPQKEIEHRLTMRGLLTEEEWCIYQKLFVEDQPAFTLRGREIPARKFDALHSRILTKFRRAQCASAHTCR